MSKSLSKTPAPAKDRIYGSKKNPKGSASSEKSAKDIKLSSNIVLALMKKLKEFKETHNTKKVSLNDLKAVYRRGLGAYSSSHRPTISGGKPNTRNAWAMARVNAFLRKAGGGEYKKAYVQDDDLLKYDEGGELNSNFTPIFKWGEMNIEQDDGSFITKESNDFFLWIYDNSDSQKKLSDGIYEYAYPTIDFGNDLEKIWDDFKQYKGNEHIIGFIIGKALPYFEKEGYWLMEIGIMTTRPNFRRKGVNNFGIKYLRDKFNLKKEQVRFYEPTEEGQLFINSNKYKDGELKAPNGKPSNLTPEQYELVRTPEFKAWFGDWENNPESASKVVDENGEPLVVWHGFKDKWWLKNDSFVFNPLLEGKNTKIKKRPLGALYFASNYKSAKSYSDDIIYPFYLNFRNPKVIDAENKDLINVLPFLYQRKENTEYNDESDLIVKNTYDYYGFKYRKEDLTDIFVTSYLFNKIKIADGSNTTFEGSNADVRYDGGGEVPKDLRELPYYKGAYKGAEFYSIEDGEYQKMADRWYNLMLKHQGGKRLNEKEFEEFKKLSHDLYKSDEYKDGGEVDEEALQLIDIISIDPNNERYAKYKDLLKSKFNIDYDVDYANNDENIIEYANLEDLKDKNDFLNYENYVKYAKKIFRLRGFIENQPNHIEGIVDIELASKIGKELGFEVVFKEYNGYGNYAEVLGDTLRMPKEVDINTFIHEIGHFFDHIYSKEYNGKAKNSLYATSLYFIGRADEVFAENFMTFFIAPDWLKNNLPQVYYELNEKIPQYYKEIINNLIHSQNSQNLNLKYAEGGEVDEHKETYQKWKSLVNMSYSELKKFYDSEEGKKAGLKPSEAKAQGIDSGRESARWIMKMKATPVSKWTPAMWKWAKKQISFISRMSGMKGDLYDEKGNKTRKYLSLLIWGNDPKKYNAGGEIKSENNNNYYTLKYIEDGVVKGHLDYTYSKDYVMTNDLDYPPYNFKSEIYIDIVEVDKNERHKGIAKKLLQRLIEDAKKLNVDVITLRRDSGMGYNYGSVYDTYLKNLYSSFGFVETWTAEDEIKSSGEKSRVAMHLALNKKYKSGGETENDMKFNEPIMYHEKDGNFFVGKNTIYYWLYDDKEAGKKLNDGEFDFVLFPPATLGMASQKGFVPPLQLIWTKKYQNKTKGSEHLMGIIEAYYDEANNKLYIKMMTANPKMRGKGIMSYLIKSLRQEFKLSQDDVIFVDTTKEGKRFEQAKHYADGGLIAPNGRPSNLTPEQYELVRTPEFKAWFGDWENNPESASKVVDENGEPLALWHFAKRLESENQRFYIFNVDRQLGSHFGSLNQVKNLRYIKGQDYLLPNLDNKDFKFYQVFLNIKNPIRLKDVGIFEADTLTDALNDIKSLKDYDWEYINNYTRKSKDSLLDRVKHIAKGREIDGAIYLNRYESSDDKSVVSKFDDASDLVFKNQIPTSEDSYIAFYSEQIKLADGTNTTFDGSNPDIRYDYGGELQKLGFTEQEIETWKNQNKVSQRQEQNPDVKEYALKLKSGEISQDEYIKAVRKYLPILPFTEVPQIPTLLEIVGSLKSNQIETGIIGYTKFIEDGEMVATRLDIPAYNGYDIWVVSVHDATKEKNAIGYGQTAYLKDINFITSPKVALNIATERSDKTTFARMKGTWINKDPHEVREMGVKYMNNPEWVQVGMNPYRHSWFYDKTDGMPLLTAEELIQVGALVLAKNPVKTTPDNPVFAVDKNNPDIKFKKGGIFKKYKSIEQIAKEKNVSLSYAKEQLKKGMKVESEHSDSKEVQETIALQHLDEMINYYDKLKTIEN